MLQLQLQIGLIGKHCVGYTTALNILFLLRIPLHRAAENGNYDISYELLKKNSEKSVVDAKDNDDK